MRAVSRVNETYLGVISEFVRCEIDLAEGAFADQSSKSVIAHASEVRGGKFPIRTRVSRLYRVNQGRL